MKETTDQLGKEQYLKSTAAKIVLQGYVLVNENDNGITQV
jgi:hypothetical protein